MDLYRPALPTVMASAYFARASAPLDLQTDREPRSATPRDGKIEKTQGRAEVSPA